MISSKADYTHDQRYFRRVSSEGVMVPTAPLEPLWQSCLAAVALVGFGFIAYMVL